MMHVTVRKALSRFRAKATLDTSFVLKTNKTILVDEAVWTLAEVIAALTTQGKLEVPVGPKEWICWTLSTLSTLGYAEHSTDERGNLVFKSTPALLADRGQKSNELYDRKYFFQTANFSAFRHI
jgi:hypothetical protein